MSSIFFQKELLQQDRNFKNGLTTKEISELIKTLQDAADYFGTYFVNTTHEQTYNAIMKEIEDLQYLLKEKEGQGDK